MKKIKYPEHEKLKKIQPIHQFIGEFLEYLDNKKITLCYRLRTTEYYPMENQTVLAEFFKINQQKLKQEKIQMIADCTRNDRKKIG